MFDISGKQKKKKKRSEKPGKKKKIGASFLKGEMAERPQKAAVFDSGVGRRTAGRKREDHILQKSRSKKKKWGNRVLVEKRPSKKKFSVLTMTKRAEPLRLS